MTHEFIKLQHRRQIVCLPRSVLMGEGHAAVVECDEHAGTKTTGYASPVHPEVNRDDATSMYLVI